MNVNSIKKLNYINTFPGRIAQLGEHLPYKQGVTGSSPVAPTLFLIIGEKNIISISRRGSIGRAADL